MVLPNLLEQAIAGKLMTVYGAGTQARCFCSVHDIVDALILVQGCTAAVGTVINLGSQEEVSIMDLALRIKSLTQSSSEIALIPYEQAYGPGFDDMKRRVPDISRAKELLGWKPSKTLDEIILEMDEALAVAGDGRRQLAQMAG
jgi:UDP-glucose 4-epimerase